MALPPPVVHGAGADQPRAGLLAQAEGVGMTVKELRDALQGVDDDVLVVLSKDSEGNYYSPLADTSQKVYVAETTWCGEVYERGQLTPLTESLGFEEGDFRQPGEDGAAPCLVLWPVN